MERDDLIGGWSRDITCLISSLETINSPLGDAVQGDFSKRKRGLINIICSILRSAASKAICASNNKTPGWY